MRKRPIQQRRQTMVWLSDDDYAHLEYIQDQTGVQARVEAIRLAIRSYARELRAEEAMIERRRQAAGPDGSHSTN